MGTKSFIGRVGRSVAGFFGFGKKGGGGGKKLKTKPRRAAARRRPGGGLGRGAGVRPPYV